VFHRDLKSSNCLVDTNNKVKLCDFGLSKIYEHLQNVTNMNTKSDDPYLTKSTGTTYWMSPEFIVDSIFTDKADIYAFGIVMWEIMMRDPLPYKDISEISMLFGDRDSLKKRPIIPNDFDIEIRDLIETCWHCDYKLRPCIK